MALRIATRSAVVILAVLAAATPAASAGEGARCTIRFELSGWSVLYQTLRGTGRLSCSNGQAANVEIVTHGGGFSFGGVQKLEGEGNTSAVRDIRDLYGVYGGVSAHAGAGASVDARAMTKGNASLSATASGQGVNLGVVFGSFRIRPR